MALEGEIPLVMQVSVGEPLNRTLQLSGVVRQEQEKGAYASGRPFDIFAGARIDIGSVKIFSNYFGRYSVSISSQNGGFLMHDSGSSKPGIPYCLILDSTRLLSHAGIFEYEMESKSEGFGTTRSMVLAIDALPEGLADGLYSDRLAFTLISR